MEKEESLMIKLTPEFQNKLFSNLLKEHGRHKLSQEIGKSRSILYHYKNYRVKAIPDFVLKRAIKLSKYSKEKLKRNIVKKYFKEDQDQKVLNQGREIRNNQLKKWKQEIPNLKLILKNNHLDFEKWFFSYKKLIDFGARKFNYIKKEKDYLEISYMAHSNKEKKEFILRFPRKIILDKEFLYFFGLWCGDRSGGGRLGICNQNKDILSFTENFLKRNFQNIEKILYISKNIREPNIFYDKKFIIDKEIRGWALSVHSINGIFSSFFYYLQNYLEDFLKKASNLECFFAGLFDAEGNVSLYNKSFRWACKNKGLVKIYSKFLGNLDLYKSYSGGCLISYNKKSFYENILPHLKHEKKINHTLFLCKGEGKIPSDLNDILIYIKNNPSKTQKEITKALKKSKVYSELGLLREFGFILAEDYPLRFKLNNENKKNFRSLKS